ncbi:MAG TPA: hypothetical protein VIV57_23205 [Anaeromyxobacter sp.]
MRLCSFTRLLAAAGTVYLAAASAPAFALADVTVALTAPADPDTGNPIGVDVGAKNNYTAEITNAGPDAATNVKLTVTAVPTPMTLSTLTGCAPVPGDPSSCTIANLPVTNPPTTPPAKVTVVADWAAKDAPTTCPNGALTTGTFSVSVVADNDTTPSTSSVSGTTVNDFADLVSVVTPGEQGISPGQTVAMHGVVTNNGPCLADAVTADFVYPSALGFTSATDGTPAFCSTDAIADAFAGFGCAMGPLGVAESRSFDAQFTLASLPSDLTKGAYRLEVDANAKTVHDPNSENNAGIGTNRFSKSEGSGCSTGGAGTLLALLSLVMLRFGRRRTS